MTLELALSPRQQPRRQLDLNLSVNAVFRTIRQTSSSLGGAFARRRIAFTSFSPPVCAAVNWKQPNCNASCSIAADHHHLMSRFD